MVELSSYIKQAAEQEGLSEALMPAARFLEVDLTDTKAKIERLSSEMRQLEPGIREAAKTLEREQRTIEDYLKGLKAELEDAIGIEKPELTSRIREANAQLESIAARAKANLDPLAERESAIEAEGKAQAIRAEFSQKILKVFPDAKTIDLQCLVLLRNSVGLPALGLFDINSPTVSITVRSNNTDVSIEAGRVGINIPDPVSRALKKIIETATGVTSQSLEQYHAGRWGPNYGDGGEWESAYTSPGWISIDAQFPLKSRTIPHQAREIIRSAVKSKLFEQVLLLAEIEGWIVTYSERPQRPKIEGVIAGQTVAKDDPLILGTKVINGQLIAFILGEFNTSKLEHYAGSEFSEKP